MSTRIVITGASSGIGAALAVAMARPGRSIGLVGRQPAALAKVAAQVRARGADAVEQACDVADIAASGEAWQSLRDRLGGIDTLVVAAGIMPEVAPDEFDPGKDAAIVQTNVIGAMAWLNWAARDFAAQGRGTLCGIGSVAGDRGRKPAPAYGASKAALHTFLESLRNRLYDKGVRVVTVKPGPIDTPMTRASNRFADGKGLYPVAQAAERIARAIERGEHTVYVPGKWRLIMAVIRAIPSFVFRKLSI